MWFRHGLLVLLCYKLAHFFSQSQADLALFPILLPMSAFSSAPGGQEKRFAAYLDRLAQAAEHADRVEPLKSYCKGLLLPGERKVPEPIRIRIWPANHVDAIENSWSAQYETSTTGAFQIGPLLPGTYVIATYLFPADFKERSRDVNYVLSVVPQPWFYPGTTDSARAKPITVGFAQQVSGIHFVVPPASVKVPAKTHSVSHNWYPMRAPSIAKNLTTSRETRSRQCVKHYFTSEIGGAHGALAANSCSRISAQFLRSPDNCHKTTLN